MEEIILLDCYTDEPAGLGVPPYLGTYPRYLAGYFISKGYKVKYMTIDDLRSQRLEIKQTLKTNIRQYNFTVNKNSSIGNNVVAILGVHTPGKYLSAVPGTFRELEMLKLEGIEVTGPAVFGTQLEGGKIAEKNENFKIKDYCFSYDEIAKYAVIGSQIIKQIPDQRVIEIETGHGCNRGKCSFCTEPMKNSLEFRKLNDVLNEIKAFYDLGCRHFRIGKQSDFYSFPDVISLLKQIREAMPDIEVLHIDNVNPNSIIADKGYEITKAIVKYCTDGNIAAFGVESFDKEVVKANHLNTSPETVYKATKILNEYGGKVGPNGMPAFLPGINIILGLANESKKTFEENFNSLNRMLSEDLLIRRINIRQLAILPGTPIEKIGKKFLVKNKKYYWKAKNNIRQNIDYPMLKKVIPLGTILKNVRMEVHDGNNTFGRQLGTYPIIVGIKKKLELKKFYDIKITDHMLRSITGEVVN